MLVKVAYTGLKSAVASVLVAVSVHFAIVLFPVNASGLQF